VEKEGFEPKKGYADSRAGHTMNIGDLIMMKETDDSEESSGGHSIMWISIIVSLVLLSAIIALIFVLVKKFKGRTYQEE
jgi:hypothetical protein